jgi:Ser/Thr protein kinase RdoA (MazF antagonist)
MPDSAATTQAFTRAARNALKAFPIDRGELTLFSVSENITFKVIDAKDGSAYALRLHRPLYHTLEELKSEHLWTRALAAAGVAVAAPVAARDGADYVEVCIPGTRESRYAGMVRWVDGDLLEDVLRGQSDAALVEGYFERLGSIIAAMHNQSSGWRPPARFVRPALNEDGLMGDEPFWGRFWEHEILSTAERGLLFATRQRVRDALIRYGRHPTIYSMIHSDLHPGNVLLDRQRSTVIDFDDAAFGWHLYDLAGSIFDSEMHATSAAIQRACIKGYRAVRSITDEALTLLPMFTLVRGMALIGWAHQRPGVTSPGFIKPIKDLVCTRCEEFQPPC